MGSQLKCQNQVDIRAVEVVGSVTYGVTPPGYKQSVPGQLSAPAVQDHKRYGYLFDEGTRAGSDLSDPM